MYLRVPAILIPIKALHKEHHCLYEYKLPTRYLHKICTICKIKFKSLLQLMNPSNVLHSVNTVSQHFVVRQSARCLKNPRLGALVNYRCPKNPRLGALVN